jgi:hypothetical protein
MGLEPQQVMGCKKCSQFRSISNHLFELGLCCELLDNEINYLDDVDGEQSRIIKSSVIGQWLKLAGQLNKVEVDTWQYSDGSEYYCETIAYMQDSNSKHWTDYSTALTRFMFVTNALEETYRFVAEKYNIHAEKLKITKANRFRKPSMKAAFLIDTIPKRYFPKHFLHKSNNYKSLFKTYQKFFGAQLTGLNKISGEATSYPLHLIRNLRNHIAHGIFPIVDDPEYFGDQDEAITIVHLLGQSARLAALYIQMLMRMSNQTFNSIDYHQIIDSDDRGYQTFIAMCNMNYVISLHLDSKFTLNQPYSYNDD